jgi:hypothetical protein
VRRSLLEGLIEDLQLMSDDDESLAAELLSYTVSKRSSLLCKSTVGDIILVRCSRFHHLEHKLVDFVVKEKVGPYIDRMECLSQLVELLMMWS